MCGRRGLLLKDVLSGGAYNSVAQRICQRHLIHQRTTAHVHQHSGGFHSRELFSSEDLAGLRRYWRRQDNVIGLREQVLEINECNSMASGSFGGWMFRGSNDLHVEGTPDFADPN